jgi:protein TonB
MRAQSILARPIVPALLAALLVSTGLFSLMYSVISGGHHGAQKSETLATIDFVRLKRDTEVESMERPKPPPPPSQPPPPARLKVASESAVQDVSSAFGMPNLGLAATVSGGPIAGQMGSAAAMFDGDILPLQRIPPQYPRDAARNGVTGWVQLEVLVNADGSVRSARVMDAKPRGIFEAAAVSAVMRWKFKPKVVDGKPVEQRGSQKIEFNLNTPS